MSPDGYLNDHGDFERVNNQLLCFDPCEQEWTNVKTSGTIPGPRMSHAAANIGDKVWLYGGWNYSR